MDRSDDAAAGPCAAAGIAVRGESGGILAGGADVPEWALDQPPVEPEHVVARHTEYMPDTAGLQLLQQIGGDRRRIHGIRALQIGSPVHPSNR